MTTIDSIGNIPTIQNGNVVNNQPKVNFRASAQVDNPVDSFDSELKKMKNKQRKQNDQKHRQRIAEKYHIIFRGQIAVTHLLQSCIKQYACPLKHQCCGCAPVYKLKAQKICQIFTCFSDIRNPFFHSVVLSFTIVPVCLLYHIMQSLT